MRVFIRIFLLTIGLANGANSIASVEDPRLLFARLVDDQCQIGVWQAASKSSITLIEVETCPDHVFASATGDSAFVVDQDRLYVLSTRNPAQNSAMPMPSTEYRDWEPRAELTMHPNNLSMIGTTVMEPVAAGFLASGEVGLQLRLNGPADGSINYLLRYADDNWQIVEELGCGTWDIPCLIELLQFKSSDSWLWPEDRLIWHPAVATNSFFMDATVESARPDLDYWETSLYTLALKIDDVTSTLTFVGNPSEHTDTIHIFGIDLRIDDSPAINLSANQCLTSLVGRYLLVEEFFQGRFAVTDLGTGDTLIGDLKAAMWID